MQADWGEEENLDPAFFSSVASLEKRALAARGFAPPPLRDAVVQPAPAAPPPLAVPTARCHLPPPVSPARCHRPPLVPPSGASHQQQEHQMQRVQQQQVQQQQEEEEDLACLSALAALEQQQRGPAEAQQPLAVTAQAVSAAETVLAAAMCHHPPAALSLPNAEAYSQQHVVSAAAAAVPQPPLAAAGTLAAADSSTLQQAASTAPPATAFPQQPIQQQQHPGLTPALAELRLRVEAFRHRAAALPAPKPKHARCPGVYGRGCGGTLQYVTMHEGAWKFWSCSNWPDCAYREHPPPVRHSPELQITVGAAEGSLEVSPLAGAEAAVAFCGGVRALLRTLAVPMGEQQAAAGQAPAVPAAAAACGQQQMLMVAAAPGAIGCHAAAMAAPPAAEVAAAAAAGPAAATLGALAAAGPSVGSAAVQAAATVARPKEEGISAGGDTREQQPAAAGPAAPAPAAARSAGAEGGAADEGGPLASIPADPSSSAGEDADGSEGGPPVVLPLGDYERLSQYLQRMGRMLGFMLLSSAGCIPAKTLQAARGQLRWRSPPDEVERRYAALPSYLEAALLPFQREGVRLGLERRGRVLLADEMGVGKTVQAIALSACYQEEWPLLVVAPASLRLVWAEELEKWLPQLRPSSIHVIEGKEQRVQKEKLPLVTITSYEMTQRLTCDACKGRAQQVVGPGSTQRGPCQDRHHCMATMGWKVLVVDESHTLRTSNVPPDALHTEAVVRVAQNAQRAIFLTGTPSLSRPFDLYRQVDALRPGLLGATRTQFATAYCNRQLVPVPGGQGSARCDNSGLARGTELHSLLKREVMLRRLKRDVLAQLPPKRRQVIRLPKPPPSAYPKSTRGGKGGAKQADEEGCEGEQEEDGREDEGGGSGGEDGGEEGNGGSGGGSRGPRHRQGPSAAHATALAKLPSMVEWLASALGVHKGRSGGGSGRAAGRRGAALQAEEVDADVAVAVAQGEGSGDAGAPKFLVFAHHKDVMNALAAALDGTTGYAPVPYVRIDGSNDSEERRTAVHRFAADPAVRVALLSVTAAGVGLDFSAASVVVFAELPDEVAHVRQAEDRAHRQGQRHPVNVYFLCAKGTRDERRWQRLNRSLARVAAVHDGSGGAGGGSEGAAQQAGLLVDHVLDAEHGGPDTQPTPGPTPAAAAAAAETQLIAAGQAADQAGEAAAATPAAVDDSAAAAAAAPAAGTAAAAEHGPGSCCEPAAAATPAAAPTAFVAAAASGAGAAAADAELTAGLGTAEGKLLAQARQLLAAAAELAAPVPAELPSPLPLSLSPLARRLLGRPLPPAACISGTATAAALTWGAPQGGPEQQQRAGVQQQQRGGEEEEEEGAWGVWFEVSANTGRVHLHSAPDGSAPLRLSLPMDCLLVEDSPAVGELRRAVAAAAAAAGAVGAAAVLAQAGSSVQGASGGIAPVPGSKPVVIGGIGVLALQPARMSEPWLALALTEAREFAAEWQELRAVHQSRLSGCVLRAPLHQAVEEVEAAAQAAGAYGSCTNRFLDARGRSDLQLPEGAQWRAVQVHFKQYNREVQYQQPFMPDGGRLCITCAQPIPGELPAEAPLQGMAFLFCSGGCEARFGLRSNSSAYRRALYRLEQGRCTMCRVDCHDLVKRLQGIEKGTRNWEQWRWALLAKLHPRLAGRGFKAYAERLVKHAVEGNAWQADHIRAVYQGGGLCDVDNLRTLCTSCHADVTKMQAKERAAERAAERAGASGQGSGGSAGAGGGGVGGQPVTRAQRQQARLKRILSNSDADDFVLPGLAPAAGSVPLPQQEQGQQQQQAAAAEVAGAQDTGAAAGAAPPEAAGGGQVAKRARHAATPRPPPAAAASLPSAGSLQADSPAAAARRRSLQRQQQQQQQASQGQPLHRLARSSTAAEEAEPPAAAVPAAAAAAVFSEAAAAAAGKAPKAAAAAAAIPSSGSVPAAAGVSRPAVAAAGSSRGAGGSGGGRKRTAAAVLAGSSSATSAAAGAAGRGRPAAKRGPAAAARRTQAPPPQPGSDDDDFK